VSGKAGTEPLGILFQRNGHLPTGPGPASPGWGQSQCWQVEGASPSISTYDQPFAPSDTDFHSELRAGLKRLWGRLGLSAPTMTRQARVGAQRSSLPASRFFQSYAHAGTAQGARAGGAGRAGSGPPAREGEPWLRHHPQPRAAAR
jgi:hypothetical protein